MTEHAISKAERNDLLVIAQQKLDEVNRGNSFVAGTSKHGQHSMKGFAASSLLSTLLYVALMSYKVDDMKAMLKHVDMESYEQWEALLAVLHSPEFHVKERLLQNERASRIFERKNQYKMKAEQLATSRTAIKCKFDEVQRISNETCNEMSKTINILQREVSELNQKLYDAHAKIEMERKLVESLKEEAVSKDIAIDNLNQQLKSANEDALSAATVLCESKSRVESIESKLSQNASLSEHLTSFSENLQSFLRKSTVELLAEAKKESNAQMEDRVVLSGISLRSQEIHEVLLQVKSQSQVDIDEICESIRSTMFEVFQQLCHTLDNQNTHTKPRSSDKEYELNNDSEQNATDRNSTDAFVQHVLSEAFATTLCT
ncbi:hypothetical protein ACHAXM_007498 [Skeletonema potamos]